MLHDLELEYPIICWWCLQLPATCRVRTFTKPTWTYWCYLCFEQNDHDDEPLDDMSVVDLDDGSNAEESDHPEDPHEDHPQEDDTQSCASFSSWNITNGHGDVLSASEWKMETQSNAMDDDTASMCSGSSFNLVFARMDNDDTASVSSFQLVSTDADDTASVSSFHMLPAACHEQQQGQQEQLDPEPQQELSSKTCLLLKKEQQLHQQHQSPDGTLDVEPDGASEMDKQSLGVWQEDQEMILAMQVSLKQADKDKDLAIAQPKAPPTAMRPPKGVKPLVPMEKIDEAVSSHQDSSGCTQYEDLSGCTHQIFTSKEQAACTDKFLCPHHGNDHWANPYCRFCVNYQFMLEKHQQDVAQAMSLEAHFESCQVIWIEGFPFCNIHLDDMQERCVTCSRVFELRDEHMAQHHL